MLISSSLLSVLIYQSDSDDEPGDGVPHKACAAPEYKCLIAIAAGNAKNKRLKHVIKIEHRRASRLSLSEDELVKCAALYPTDVIR